MSQMPRKLSPRAPSSTLEQALERVLRVYEQERLHAAPVDAVAQALGFSNANNGSAAKSIASLRYFGLLERPMDGFLAVSKAVEAYKFAPSSDMKAQLIIQFLKTPALYQELLTKYSGGLPSTATLKYELIQKGFLPQAVDAVLAAFIESVSYAKYFDVPPSSVESGNPDEQSYDEGRVEISEHISQRSAKISSAKPLSPINSSEEFDQIPIRLSNGRKAWLSIPSPFYESDKARIKAQVDILFADGEE
jgi:hypothetical protein